MQKFIQKSFTLFFTLFFLLCSNSLYAQVAPEINWKLIKTDHFDVIFDANQHALAKIYAQEAERAHYLLAPLFNNEAPNRTVLILNDSTDSANGYSTAIPRQLINVYPVLPDSMDFLSYYNIWPREMIIHEYTHTLNIEPANGIWAPFRFLFGSIFRPNALLPRWYLEGLAVNTETQFTDYGRLRSPLYRAMIRSQIKEETWGNENISQINEVTTPTWPLGTRPYFYGALVWSEMINQQQHTSIGLLNDRYSRRIPYFLSSPAEDLFGQNYAGLLESMYDRQYKIAKKQILEIDKSHSTDQKPSFLKISGHLQYSPQISPNNENLVFINRNVDTKEEIYLFQRKNSTQFESSDYQKVATGLEGVTRVSWLPDSNSFVYDNQDTFDRYYSFTDLKIYHLESKKSKVITRGLRAKNPAVSPNGEQVAFIQNTANGTNLSIVDIKGNNLAVLYEPQTQVRVSWPEFLNQNEIIFSERELSGIEYLRKINIHTKKTETILNGYEPIHFAHLTKLGVIFVSTKTGVANLYLADKDLKNAKPLSNTSTHIFNATYDEVSKKLIVSRLGASGSYLEFLDTNTINITPPSLDLNEGYRWTKYNEPPHYAITQPTEDYSALTYLLPQYWMPTVFSGPYASAISAYVAAQDPLEKHKYELELLYDTLAEKPGYGFAYINNQTRVQTVLSGYDQTLPVDGLKSFNRVISYTGSGWFYLPKLNNNWRGFAGWNYLANQYEENSFNVQQGPTLGFRYSDISMRGYQISPISGSVFGASYTHYLPEIGEVNFGNIDYGRANAETAFYWSKWLPKYNAIKISMNGTYSPKNRSIYSGTVIGGGDYLSATSSAPYMVRGYPIGEFIGWSLFTGSIEYRFPIWYIYSGPQNTIPFFSKRLHGAIFYDTITLDGGYYDKRGGLRRARLNTFFSGYGAELRWDTTFLYHAPITLRFGIHYGEKTNAYGGYGPFIGMMLPEI